MDWGTLILVGIIVIGLPTLVVLAACMRSSQITQMLGEDDEWTH